MLQALKVSRDFKKRESPEMSKTYARELRNRNEIIVKEEKENLAAWWFNSMGCV